jgi:LAO/AO transport system kinase
VSKCDRPDARSTISDLKQMLALGISLDSSSEWRPPVVATSSVKGEGFEELVSALEKHKAFLETSEAGRARSRKIAEFRMLKTAEDLLRIRFHEHSAGRVRALADRLVSREINPYTAGEQLIEGIGA